jgi:serine/threonine protein kinase
MDVKPENILISTSGEFILGDLGSVVKFGEKTKSTKAYIPHDMQEKDTNQQTGSAEIDWWMFAMVFCEKAAGHNAGEGAREPKTNEIRGLLSQNQRMLQVWPLLVAKLDQ